MKRIRNCYRQISYHWCRFMFYGQRPELSLAQAVLVNMSKDKRNG